MALLHSRFISAGRHVCTFPFRYTVPLLKPVGFWDCQRHKSSPKTNKWTGNDIIRFVFQHTEKRFKKKINKLKNILILWASPTPH